MVDRRLTTAQACELLAVHRNTLGNRVRAKAIKAYRDGNRVYYLESELLRYIGSGEVEPEWQMLRRRAHLADPYADD